MNWKDPRLSWNTNDYNGTSEITLPVSKIWVPDIVVQVIIIIKIIFSFFYLKSINYLLNK